MNNNYYRYAKSANDKFINIPVNIKFDNVGREEGINEFEIDVVGDIINGIDDFETTKYANAPYPTNQSLTSINYQFNFFNSFVPVLTAVSSDWYVDYTYQGFTSSELYYFANSFKKSFFKLDFYDSNKSENQRAYFSVILPTQQGTKIPASIGPTVVDVKQPNFILDYVGADKEGFFIYWLKERDYININDFYVSVKFFNGKTGQFIRFMNEPQSTLSGTDKFSFDKSLYFYYKVVLDVNNYEYEIFKQQPQSNGTINYLRVGDSTTPIKWYEYVNP